MRRERAAVVVPGSGGAEPEPASARGLLKERAYDEIKRLILTGDLTPGTFLAERQLAARLGMSKTPVRSALERLESEGFISISPQQGAIIRDLSLDEIADQYEIRTALETFVVRTVAGRLTPNSSTRSRPTCRPSGRTSTQATSRGASPWMRSSMPSSRGSWATGRSCG